MARPHDSWFGRLVDGLNAAGSLIILAIMLLMCADVVARDVANKPIDGVAEMVAISIIAIVFLQLPSTLRHGRMTRAELFIDGFTDRHPRMGNALLALFDVAGTVVMLGVFLATWPTFVSAWETSEFYGSEGVFTFPVWPLKIIVLTGCALTFLQYVLHVRAHLAAAFFERKA